MATNRIKGIEIQIGANTTNLQKALKDVDKTIKTTQTNLKDVNKLLKLDPTNTELLKQKQEYLNTSIKETEERLKTLKDAYKDLDGKGTDEAKTQQQALAREIVETEQNLKSLKDEYQDFGSVAKQQLTAVGEKLKDVGDKVTDVGKDLTMKLTTPIAALVAGGLSYNAQIEQYQTMFTTLTGSAEEADRVISQLQADAQKSPFDTASLVEANQYLISAGVEADDARDMINNLGNAIAATGGGSAELSRMAQNLQQVKNVGKATSQDIKQFANAGINIYGLLADATGKTTEEVKDMDVTYEELQQAFALASQEGGKYYGAMEAQSGTLNGSLSSLKESFSQMLGSITESLLPIIVDIVAKIKSVVDWITGLDEGTRKIILTVALVIAAIGPVVTIIGGIISAVGTLTTVIGALMSPMGLIVAAIAAVIVAGVMLVKHWDEIKEFASALWEVIKTIFGLIRDWIVEKFTEAKDKASEIFQNIKENITEKITSIKDKVTEIFTKIKDTISDKITSAKDKVKEMIDKIKSIFDFQWSLPKLKLPHVSISGKFSINPPSVPHFSVDWYAKAMENGMILNNPTIFGMMDGKLLGAGEAGSETIVGTRSLMNMIRSATAGQGTVINMTINAQDQDVYQLADLVSERLTNQLNRERLVFSK